MSAPDDKNPYTYWGRWLQTYDGGYDMPPSFLIVPVADEAHANRIRSAMIEGGETLYPLDYWQIVNPAYWSEAMTCDLIALCLQDNVLFLDAIKDRILNDPAFASAIQQAQNRTLTNGNEYQSDNELTNAIEQTSNSLDIVWGGCREVIEYWAELAQSLCFFLSGIDSAIDVVSAIYDRSKRKKINIQAEDSLGNPVTVGDDGELVGDVIEFVPNFLGQMAQFISESTMLSFIASLIDIGTSFVLADITDTRLEALSCIMFNIITCDGEESKPPPYAFTNEVIYQSAIGMIGNPDAGLLGQFIGACVVVGGTIGSFVSAYPIGETHRNWRIGTLSPSAEWEVICDVCVAPDAWEYTFDFLVDPFTTIWDASPAVVSGFTNIELTQWVAGRGWGLGRILSPTNNQSDFARIRGGFDNSTTDSVEIEMEFVAGSSGSFANQLVLLSAPTTNIYVKTLTNTAGIKTETRAIDIATSEFFIQVRGYSRTGNFDPQGEVFIRKVKFTGTGFNPFI